MRVNKIKVAERFTIRPSERKIKQIKSELGRSGLPKEEPIHKDVFVKSNADIMESIKNEIQISIENMKRNG